MKKPDDKFGRTNQLIDEIGIPLLEAACAASREEAKNVQCLVEGKWVKILEQLDAGDPMPLLDLLNVPTEVKPHFEDAFKRLRLSRRGMGRGRPPIPSYRLASDKEVDADFAAWFVWYLTACSAPEDRAIELMSLIFKVTPSKIRAMLKGDSSADRNLKARRAAR